MNPFVCLLFALALVLLPSSAGVKSRLVAGSPGRWCAFTDLSWMQKPALRWLRGMPKWLARRASAKQPEPLRKAAGWDLFSVAMRSGLPVPVAVRVVAEEFDREAASTLREVADLLSWGTDPVSAWEPALQHSDTAEVARSARRAARTGSALAVVAADIAADARETLRSQAEARSQRAAVWVSAPLGLCFLPGFVCLGVAPVVVGMVHRLMGTW